MANPGCTRVESYKAQLCRTLPKLFRPNKSLSFYDQKLSRTGLIFVQLLSILCFSLCNLAHLLTKKKSNLGLITDSRAAFWEFCTYHNCSVWTNFMHRDADWNKLGYNFTLLTPRNRGFHVCIYKVHSQSCRLCVKIGIIDAMSDLISTSCANLCIWSRSQRACKAQIV